ncbi:hypothetical protein B0H11DRAFT_1901390 [Mycena galericulata]|nr:hypothetical protein B0H11DRAFT_1901390 [Mycena galericulata]
MDAPAAAFPQSPGTVLVDFSSFPEPSQEFVRKIYTVVGRPLSKRWGAQCTGCMGSEFQCRFTVVEWWYETYPPGGPFDDLKWYNNNLTRCEDQGFKEIWHHLKMLDLAPWFFEGSDEDGYPREFVTTQFRYVQSLFNRETLFLLRHVYELEDRPLMVTAVNLRINNLDERQLKYQFAHTVSHARSLTNVDIRRSARPF